jgi:hypothetical protein
MQAKITSNLYDINREEEDAADIILSGCCAGAVYKPMSNSECKDIQW